MDDVELRRPQPPSPGERGNSRPSRTNAVRHPGTSTLPHHRYAICEDNVERPNEEIGSDTDDFSDISSDNDDYQNMVSGGFSCCELPFQSQFRSLIPLSLPLF